MAIDAEADRLLADAADRARRYLAGLDDRAVVPDRAALSALASFDEPLPESPGDPAATLALLDEAGSPATVTSAGGRYFGFVTGGSLPVAVAANWLATAWDQNTALPVMSPVAARLHEVVTRWLADLLGLPAGTAVVFVTGSAMANTAALTTARDQQLARAGWDVQANGLFGAPELPVVIGENAHTTLVRALGVVGLGRERVIRIPVDDQGRIRADRLPKDVAGPAVICAQAGEVNTGAFDPFPAMVSWARERDAWLHVDGAFGLWALADPSRAHLTAGLAGADSWAADAHKWLNVPYDCGICLVRRPQTCAAASPRQPATCLPTWGLKRRTTRRRPRSAPARWTCGRCCARWAARVSPTWWSGHATMPRPWPTCCAKLAWRCSTTWYSTRFWYGPPPASRRRPWWAQSRMMGPAGAARPCGRAGRPCGSASPAGRPPIRTSRRARRRSSQRHSAPAQVPVPERPPPGDHASAPSSPRAG